MSIAPVATHTARIRWRLHSIASPLARFSSAARAADACTINGIPRRGLNPMNTTSPPPPGIIERSATVRVRSHTASTLRRCTARQPLAEIRSGVETNCPPALFTSTSIRPEPVQDGVDERGHLLGFADVGARHRQDLSAGGRELGGDLLERFGSPAGDHDARRRSARTRARSLGPGPSRRRSRAPRAPRSRRARAANGTASDMRAHDARPRSSNPSFLDPATAGG